MPAKFLNRSRCKCSATTAPKLITCAAHALFLLLPKSAPFYSSSVYCVMLKISDVLIISLNIMNEAMRSLRSIAHMHYISSLFQRMREEEVLKVAVKT